jgi:perosamine synthetase
MASSASVIPVNEPLLAREDLDTAFDALRSGWISSAGGYIEEFECAWARYCGMSHGVAVVNGTAALQIAVSALGIVRGDEVIMPSSTIMSCATAAIYAGAQPVFVDVDPETWCLDPAQVSAAVTSRTKAIMPVHLYGHPVDMDPILELADRYDLYVIEDAAEAHGAEYRGRRCGSLGDISCFSFYANKIITTGEGGMVLTNDSAVAERLRALRNLCFEGDRRFLHRSLGHNFRMTNVQAALGVNQVSRIESLVDRKRAIASRYESGLRTVLGIQLPIEREWAKSVYWMYGFVLNPELGITAAECGRRLLELGIHTRPFFFPLHRQPALRALGLLDDAARPVSEMLGEFGLYLPSGLSLADDDVDRVVDAVAQAMRVP